MKKALKWILPIALVILLIVSAGWYMFVYDTATMQAFLNTQAIWFAEGGHFDAANRLFDYASRFSDGDQDGAIELAEVYKSAGNYTKAESTLTKAIAGGGSVELYSALCKTYVEQDKLLDAVNMLDTISDPEIKAELDQLRPAAPSVNYESGFYNQYINLTFSADSGTLYATTDGEYPSIEEDAYTDPIALTGGETKVYALVVNETGLVSPISILSYTITGVVEEVTLTDPVIEADVRQKLMFGENTAIYTDDLWTISEYEVPADAASVADLQYFARLKKLTISNRKLDSLSFLSGMAQLEELSLVNCTFPDELETIAALPGLKSLTMTKCSLSTIAKLANAKNLTTLDISNNAVGDISVLSGMPQMSVLNISHNAVTDLTAVSGLTQLKKLDASYNSIASLAPISGCTGLQSLNITSNGIAELSSLSGLTGLTQLYAGYNQLADVSVLANCLQLQELNISHNALEDISALSALVKLTHFDFSYNDVITLPGWPKDCALVEINGEHNFMSDISTLGGMKNLNLVYMDYNNLSDISFLADCPALQQVNVYGTSVSDVNALLDRSIIVNYDPT